jgi:hypothetical protein
MHFRCDFAEISARDACDARAAHRLAPGDDGIERDPCTAGRRLVRVNGAATRRRDCINPEQTACFFMISKPQQRLSPRGESPLSDMAAIYP